MRELADKDIRFTDDKAGLEARFLLVGYAELLRDSIKDHCPLSKVIEVLNLMSSIAIQQISHSFSSEFPGQFGETVVPPGTRVPGFLERGFPT